MAGNFLSISFNYIYLSASPRIFRACEAFLGTQRVFVCVCGESDIVKGKGAGEGSGPDERSGKGGVDEIKEQTFDSPEEER
jgi:hypothetical protein